MTEQLEYFFWGLYNKYLIRTNTIEKRALNKKHFGGKKFLSEQAGNDYITYLINSNAPAMIARYGANELAIMRQIEEKRLGIRKEVSDILIQQFCNGAGFFPADIIEVERFSHLMLEAGKNVDLLGVWMKPVNPMENYFVKKYDQDVITTPLRALEPWYHNHPWSAALKGKNVLVIHPFADTIQKQFTNRERIYPNGLLPDFNLYTIKAVQTIAGRKDERFSSWFDALDYMYEASLNINFDIAIIGCGAYGFPLAAKLKQKKKKAIHLGGPTQLLFGIKGKRWDTRPEITCFYNEYWTRPSEKETIKNNNTVENGCYW